MLFRLKITTVQQQNKQQGPCGRPDVTWKDADSQQSLRVAGCSEDKNLSSPEDSPLLDAFIRRFH